MSARHLLPLPSRERVGVRGRSCLTANQERASFNAIASTRPSSAPSGHLLSHGTTFGSPGGEKGRCPSETY